MYWAGYLSIYKLALSLAQLQSQLVVVVFLDNQQLFLGPLLKKKINKKGLTHSGQLDGRRRSESL